MIAIDRPLRWLKEWRNCRRHLGIIERTRARGAWPPSLSNPPEWSGTRVLVARNDFFGDSILTLPFLARLQEAAEEVRFLTPDRVSRELFGHLDLDVIADRQELGDWKPDVIVFPKPCRQLRSPRLGHHLWDFVDDLLDHHPGTPCLIPSMHRSESMSLHVPVYGSPFSGWDAIRVLERFADGLGLPRSSRDLLAPIRRNAAADERSIVLNLTAGTGDPDGRRFIPLELWRRFHAAIREDGDVSLIVLPSDERRRQELEDAGWDDVPVFCEPDINRVARWIASRQLLISPETALCHLARSLDVPTVVLSPANKLPYWYPPRSDQRTVCAKYLADLDVEAMVTATRELLALPKAAGR